ncbi:MAG TPA: EI24 domain-containing protein [Caldimonas sp.]|nr:EI24 domain-containing protein [Caldimonas sp.]
MTLILDSFWRAVAYCLHPRVVLLSLAPLVVVGGLAAIVGWYGWEAAVSGVRDALESSSLLVPMFRWLDAVGAGGFRGVLAPLLVVAAAVPVVVVLVLLIVTLTMTPAIVRLVAARRFPALERRHGGALWQGVATSVGCTLVALVALFVSMPLWLIPPLVLMLPPLIWGWLTYRVLSFDVLAVHASAVERRALLSAHRWPLIGMGIACGCLSAAPSIVWATSALALVFAPILIVVSVWLYTLVFAFSSLWFAHYALAALQGLRAREGPPAAAVPVPMPLTHAPSAGAAAP